MLNTLKNQNVALKHKIYLQARAMDEVNNGIMITDANGTIVYTNRYVTEISGYNSDELIGKNPRILKSNRQNTTFYKQLWDTISHGKKWSGIIINKRKDGTCWSEQLMITPITNEDGVIEYYISIQELLKKKA